MNESTETKPTLEVWVEDTNYIQIKDEKEEVGDSQIFDIKMEADDDTLTDNQSVETKDGIVEADDKTLAEEQLKELKEMNSRKSGRKRTTLQKPRNSIGYYPASLSQRDKQFMGHQKSVLSFEKEVNAYNVQRPLTAEEQQELTDYFERNIDDDVIKMNKAIGGRDHPIASLPAHIANVAYDSSDDGSVNYYPDSDDSDLDGSFANSEPLEDIHLAELVADMENADVDEQAEVAEQEAETAIEANCNQKYMGQGKRNKTVWWSKPSDTQKLRTQILQRNRMQSIPCCNETFSSKQAAFKRLFSSAIVENIVLETNRKFKRMYVANQRQQIPKNMLPVQDTNADEMYAFIGILLYAGAEKSNLVEAKDLFHESHMPFYRAVMSLKRFEQICRFMCFDNSRTRTDRLRHDKMAPFRHIWNLLHENLTFPFIPSKDLTIYEQLVTCRNRCSFRQCIPSNPGKYGIKIFWLVDSKTNYPVSGEVYLGTQLNSERSGAVSHALVLRLAERYLDIGTNITMDSFFTSYGLAKDLYSRNTTLVGTVRANKRELPKLFTSIEEAKKRGAYGSVFCFSDEVSLVSYTTDSKKNVLLMSTAHATEEINEATRKPIIIHDYNKHKGGVDTFDKMLRRFTCQRRSSRWPMVLFHNIIDVAALAAFRLYELCHPVWNSNKSEKRKIFLKELALELVQPHLDERSKLQVKPSVKIAMDLISYRKRNITPPQSFPTMQVSNPNRRCEPCKSSRSKKKDTKTTAVCDLCLKPTCTKHYIRACEQCYLHKLKWADTKEDSDDNNDLNSEPFTSFTPRPPPAKRARKGSPVNQ